MSAWRYSACTAGVLWRRDLTLFLRQRSRLVGALLAPLLLWLALGAGIGPSFSDRAGVSYLEYLFPGVVFMLVLQVSITATMSVIEDRRQGFLQAVLAGPGARWSLVAGKVLGSASVALLHAIPFIALAPLAGFRFGAVAWLPLIGVLVLTALALDGIGFALAWALDSVQAYHLVMSLVLFPLWMVSGAVFPARGLGPVLAVVLRLNPMSYAMAGLRRSLYGGNIPAGVDLPSSGLGLEFGVLGSATAISLGIGCWIASRRASAD